MHFLEVFELNWIPSLKPEKEKYERCFICLSWWLFFILIDSIDFSWLPIPHYLYKNIRTINLSRACINRHWFLNDLSLLSGCQKFAFVCDMSLNIRFNRFWMTIKNDMLKCWRLNAASFILFFHSIEHELNHVYHVILQSLLIVMKLNGVY